MLQMKLSQSISMVVRKLLKNCENFSPLYIEMLMLMILYQYQEMTSDIVTISGSDVVVISWQSEDNCLISPTNCRYLALLNVEEAQLYRHHNLLVVHDVVLRTTVLNMTPPARCTTRGCCTWDGVLGVGSGRVIFYNMSQCRG